MGRANGSGGQRRWARRNPDCSRAYQHGAACAACDRLGSRARCRQRTHAVDKHGTDANEGHRPAKLRAPTHRLVTRLLYTSSPGTHCPLSHKRHGTTFIITTNCTSSDTKGQRPSGWPAANLPLEVVPAAAAVQRLRWLYGRYRHLGDAAEARNAAAVSSGCWPWCERQISAYSQAANLARVLTLI